MDSVTQATLGAAVAHLCWHKQLGRKALLWGAALGTLPDLDIIAYPFLDGIQRLYWHRGESHSIWFAVFGGLLIGWLVRQGRMKHSLSVYHAMAGVLLIFATHILLDYFTVYGTQLLAPFSRYGFAHANLFIIDPLYTLPLLAGILIAAAANGRTGWRANAAGIAVSSLYVLFSLTSHAYADRVFKEQLRAKNIGVIESITGATPMNTLLWRHIARTEKGLLIGYFSIIADSPEDEIRFDFVPRNEHLIAPYRGQPNVDVIEWFSKGFWVAQKKDNVLTLSDLRFGEFRASENDSPDTWQYIFVWEIPDDPDTLLQRSRAIKDGRAAVSLLWRRLTIGI